MNSHTVVRKVWNKWLILGDENVVEFINIMIETRRQKGCPEQLMERETIAGSIDRDMLDPLTVIVECSTGSFLHYAYKVQKGHPLKSTRYEDVMILTRKPGNKGENDTHTNGYP
jgi:hypothetical protein